MAAPAGTRRSVRRSGPNEGREGINQWEGPRAYAGLLWVDVQTWVNKSCPPLPTRGRRGGCSCRRPLRNLVRVSSGEGSVASVGMGRVPSIFDFDAPGPGKVDQAGRLEPSKGLCGPSHRSRRQGGFEQTRVRGSPTARRVPGLGRQGRALMVGDRKLFQIANRRLNGVFSSVVSG